MPLPPVLIIAECLYAALCLWCLYRQVSAYKEVIWCDRLCAHHQTFRFLLESLPLWGRALGALSSSLIWPLVLPVRTWQKPKGRRAWWLLNCPDCTFD